MDLQMVCAFVLRAFRSSWELDFAINKALKGDANNRKQRAWSASITQLRYCPWVSDAMLRYYDGRHLKRVALGFYESQHLASATTAMHHRCLYRLASQASLHSE